MVVVCLCYPINNHRIVLDLCRYFIDINAISKWLEGSVYRIPVKMIDMHRLDVEQASIDYRVISRDQAYMTEVVNIIENLLIFICSLTLEYNPL